jgi:hypothetical protein
MLPASSMVRYEMQRRRRADTGATMAPVGQAGMQALQVPQCAVLDCSSGNRGPVNLAQEKIRPGVAVDQIGVLADPAQAGIARQSLFQNRRAVGEHPVAEGSDRVLMRSHSFCRRARMSL